MKTVLTLLIVFSIHSVNTVAQDTSRLGLPEGAKARLSIGEGRIFDIEYSPGGTRLAAASSSGVWLFDLEIGDATALMRNGNSSSAFDVAFSPDGRTIAGSGGETVHLWDVETGQRKYTVEGVQLAYAASIAFSPDSRTLASGHASPLATHSVSDGKIYLWDAETGKLKVSRSGGVYLPTSLTFSPDGRTLAVGHFDAAPGLGSWGWVTLRDTETLESKRLLGARANGLGYFDGVESVTYSPDGNTLAVGHTVDEWFGSVRDTLRLWDVNTGENIRTLEGHTDDVNSVVFSPDGGTLASGSSDGTVLLWEIIPVADEPLQVTADVDGDGVVEMLDLVWVAGRIGDSVESRADVNRDGIVNIMDLVLVAGRIENAAGIPLMDSRGTDTLRAADVKDWLDEARQLDLTDRAIPRGIEYLEKLLEALTPERTALLPNYPNPFNPETWIPYQLARDSHVRISIYDTKGILVRHLDVGLKPGGFYTDKHYAAYWNGRNNSGELLASGLYVYVFRAGSFRSARRMAIVR